MAEQDVVQGEQPEVTVFRVLTDARFHLSERMIQGTEVITAVGYGEDQEEILGLRSTIVSEGPTKLGALDPNKLYVCSIGGIFLARAVLDGPGDQRIINDPVTQKALKLLAYCLNHEGMNQEYNMRLRWDETLAEEYAERGDTYPHEGAVTYAEGWGSGGLLGMGIPDEVENAISFIVNRNDRGKKGTASIPPDEVKADMLRAFDQAIGIARGLGI